MAVITSTDSPEAIQAALAGKKVNVVVHDSQGDDVTVEGTGNVNTDTETQAEGDQTTEDGDTGAGDTNAASKDKSSSESANEGGDEGGKVDTKVQKRIDDLIKNQGVLEARLEAATKPAPKDDKTATPSKDEAEPKPEDFDTSGEFLKALSKWAAKEARKEDKLERDKEAITAKNVQVVTAWKAQVDAGKAKYKDWDKVVGDTEIGVDAGNMLMQVPDGAEIVYYLGKNPEEAKPLATLKDRRDVAMAIGEIRAKVKAAAPKDNKDGKPNTVKEKPKPITPVGGKSGSASVQKEPKDMSYAEYKAKRNAEEAAKRKAQGGR